MPKTQFLQFIGDISFQGNKPHAFICHMFVGSSINELKIFPINLTSLISS